MITQKITYRKNTYQIKTYREYKDGILIKSELYNTNGNVIYRWKPDMWNKIYYNKRGYLDNITYDDGMKHVYIYDTDDKNTGTYWITKEGFVTTTQGTT